MGPSACLQHTQPWKGVWKIFPGAQEKEQQRPDVRANAYSGSLVRGPEYSACCHHILDLGPAPGIRILFARTQAFEGPASCTNLRGRCMRRAHRQTPFMQPCSSSSWSCTLAKYGIFRKGQLVGGGPGQGGSQNPEFLLLTDLETLGKSLHPCGPQFPHP